MNWFEKFLSTHTSNWFFGGMPWSRSARLAKHASVMNTSSDRYAASISPKITCRRVVGSVGGLLLEQLWMFVTLGLTQGRYGLVWGPFSPLYGVGAVLLTLISLQLRRKKAKWWMVFLVSMVVGGLLEQLTGWGMETLMGAVSWDYTTVPGCITKWVAWPFLFF